MNQDKENLIELLEVVRRYLEHPDVAKIGFALNSVVVAKRLSEAVERLRDEEAEEIERQEAEDKEISRSMDHCMHCGSLDIEADGSPDYGRGDLVADMRCIECGQTTRQTYNLAEAVQLTPRTSRVICMPGQLFDGRKDIDDTVRELVEMGMVEKGDDDRYRLTDLGTEAARKGSPA